MIRLRVLVLLASMSWRPACGQAAAAGGPAFEAASVKLTDPALISFGRMMSSRSRSESSSFVSSPCKMAY